jgi:hypothetical protein
MTYLLFFSHKNIFDFKYKVISVTYSRRSPEAGRATAKAFKDFSQPLLPFILLMGTGLTQK